MKKCLAAEVSDRPGWIRQAITQDDNVTIDPSFLIVVFAVFVILPSAIGVMAWLSATDLLINKREFNAVNFGTGIAAMIGALGVFITGAAMILKADKQSPAPPAGGQP